MINWVDDTLKSADPATAKVVYWVGELEFLSASENDTTGRTVKFRIVRGPDEQGAINPFAKATRKRRGFAGTHFQISLSPVEGQGHPIAEYLGVGVLLLWGDGPKGATVTFKIGDDEAVHPFMYCKRPSAEGNGSRWMGVFVELADEAPVNQKQADIGSVLLGAEVVSKTTAGGSNPSGPATQTYAQGVAVLLKSHGFHEFLREVIDPSKLWDASAADKWLKQRIKIGSKTELNSVGVPRTQWERIRDRFLEWQARAKRY